MGVSVEAVLTPSDWPVGGVSMEVVFILLTDVGGLSLKGGDTVPGFESRILREEKRSGIIVGLFILSLLDHGCDQLF